MPSIIQNKVTVSPAWITQVIYSPNKWVLQITFGIKVLFCFWSLDIYLFIINSVQQDVPIKFFSKGSVYSLLYRLFNGYLFLWNYKYLSQTIQMISILLLYRPDPYFTSVIIVTFFIRILKSVQLATRKVKRNTPKIIPQSNERGSSRATPVTPVTLHFLKNRNVD